MLNQRNFAANLVGVVCAAMVAAAVLVGPARDQGDKPSVQSIIDQANREVADGRDNDALKTLNGAIVATTYTTDRHTLQIALADIEDSAGEIQLYASMLPANSRNYLLPDPVTEGIESLRRGYEIDKDLRPKRAERDLGSIALIYTNLKQYSDALKYDQQGLSCALALGDAQGVETALVDCSAVSKRLGDFAGAMDYDRQTLLEATKASDPAGQESALYDLGDVNEHLGNYAASLHYYSRELAVGKANQDKMAGEPAIGGLTRSCEEIGEYGKALEYEKQALASAQSRQDKVAAGHDLRNIGLILQSEGEYKKALAYDQSALAQARAASDVADSGRDLKSIGQDYVSLGQTENGLVYYYQALDQAQGASDLPDVESVLDGLAGAYVQLGQYDEALSCAHQALICSGLTGDRWAQAADLSNLMSLSLTLSRVRVAIFYGKVSVNAYQTASIEASDLDPMSRKLYMGRMQKTYLKLASILLGHNRGAEAEQVLALRNQVAQTLPLGPDEQSAEDERERQAEYLAADKHGLDTVIGLEDYPAALRNESENAYDKAEDAYEAFLSIDLPTELGDAPESSSYLAAVDEDGSRGN